MVKYSIIDADYVPGWTKISSVKRNLDDTIFSVGDKLVLSNYMRGRDYITIDKIYYNDHNQLSFKTNTGPAPKTFVFGISDIDCKFYEESTNELSTIYNSLLKMQQAKDKAYGNSALKPLDIFAKHHNYGARLDEKLARVKHSEELRKNDVADLIGGLVLICKDKGWTNFDDLID